MSKIYTSADQLIGKTPLLELSHIEKAEKLEAKLLAKLEYFNPANPKAHHKTNGIHNEEETGSKPRTERVDI